MGYEFTTSKKNDHTMELFYMTLLQCMYERKMRKPHTEATEADLQALSQYVSDNSLSMFLS